MPVPPTIPDEFLATGPPPFPHEYKTVSDDDESVGYRDSRYESMPTTPTVRAEPVNESNVEDPSAVEPRRDDAHSMSSAAS